ncbi:MAG TPA: arylesterase [Burkholderiaceae bacterium]|nr:arylesterase [Burkholderiaceae bacterium]
MFVTGSSVLRGRLSTSLVLAIAVSLLALAAAARAQDTRPPPQTGAQSVILVLGDSLSAEYGLPRGAGWVQLLSDRVRSSGVDYTVVNASISGETTSGGRTRLPALLQQHRPAIVVIELGANDGLRGLPLATMRDNLVWMAQASRRAGAAVLLVGVKVPPNYGRQYSESFFQTFESVAAELKLVRVPFLLDGFAQSLESFQADRIHPNAEAQARMLDNVWPHLQPMLKSKRSAAR